MTEEARENLQSRMDRRHTIWKTVGFGILTAIPASVIALFFQPVVSFVSNAIVHTIGSIYTGYIDSVYEQATLHPANRITLLMFMVFLAVPILYVLSPRVVTSAFPRLRGRQPDVNSMTSEERRRELTNLRRRLRYSIIVYLVISTGSILIVVSGNYVSISTEATFERGMMALAPVMSDQEKKELLSEWAHIKSKNDYNAIWAKMEGLATKYKQTLP
jgi:hypothetical protein